jgi:hypothetical protein
MPRPAARKTAASARPARQPPAATPRAADGKGRVALGTRFANRQVLVEQVSEFEVIVRLARVIPEREAWLYENPAALESVRRGLSQARAGDVVEGPDLAADAKVVGRLEG